MKGKILKTIEDVLPELMQISCRMYENPEIGGEEKMASELLCEFLRKNGFETEENYRDTKYAFKAVYDSGEPGPAIGLFAEYDALPGIGHGCGHNLICTSSAGAACGLRQAAMEYGGKIIVFGTPGEENIQTKSLMAPEGAFDEADAAMMVHPNPGKTAVGGKTLAIESLQVEFFGKSSHAGAAPEKGINALDAAVHFYQMVSTRKQYFPGTNVYGIINDGGEKASVIPDYASLKYLTRAWDMETLTNLRTMVEQCAEAAAQMTGCTFEIYNNETTNAAVLSNQKMSEIFERNLAELGVTDITHDDIKGSTDMGDVSQRIPSIHPWVMLPCSSNAVLHSKEFASATMEPAAGEYIMRCAAAMALTGAEILKNEEVFAEIKADFVKSQQ